MSGHCNRDDLEALVYGALTPEHASELESHVAACSQCGDELAWLRTERSVMAERADQQQELPPELWAGIESRIAEADPVPLPVPARRGLLATLFPFGGGSGERARWFGFGLATAAAAAAVMFVVMRSDNGVQPGQVAVGTDAGAVDHALTPENNDRLAEADRALAEAEAAHLAAISALEVAYEESRGGLEPAVAARYDKQFEEMRATLSGARDVAGDDMGARLRLLDAYAAHRRSMKSALSLMQENE